MHYCRNIVYNTNLIVSPYNITEMEEKINLSQLEKKTAASIFQTGLVEIEIGLILLVSALAMMFDDIRYYLDILYIVPVIFIVLALKYVANPRLGVVNLAKKRSEKSH